jgi:hypothetical protein
MQQRGMMSLCMRLHSVTWIGLFPICCAQKTLEGKNNTGDLLSAKQLHPFKRPKKAPRSTIRGSSGDAANSFQVKVKLWQWRSALLSCPHDLTRYITYLRKCG